MIETIGVIGAGQMGTGIAQVMALAGYPVSLVDTNTELLDRAVSIINGNLDRQMSKGSITTTQGEGALERITTSIFLRDLADVDLCIEAVNENLELKTSLFSELGDILKPESILASNTSSISITKLAASYIFPGKVIGLHFMNPVPVMKLVEVIRGQTTFDHTFTEIRTVIERLNKTMVVSEDRPGFIVNRLLMPMINEAVFLVQEKISTIQDVDVAMKLGANYPMGPLELADLIGLDTCLSIMQVLHCELGESKYRPCPLLANYVNAGLLGRKTGQGFYTYPEMKK